MANGNKSKKKKISSNNTKQVLMSRNSINKLNNLKVRVFLLKRKTLFL